ncbi:MAG TPA: hypothetical protein VLB27_09885, partial [candidate division Zixibacteria bacterium]|nr:hypothetical protein [candidate division Zixibacteria bacterium]
MIFDRRGLLIYHTAGAAEDIIIPELSRSFFMDWALTNGFDTVTVNPALNAGTRYTALSAELLSHYRCIVVASEDYAHAGLGSPLPDKLRIHLNNGGREIIVSRDTRLSASDWGVFLAGTLGILSTHFVKPMRCNNTGCSLSLTFAGAESQDPGYPELDVDSLRAFDNEFVRNWLGLGVPIIGNGFLPAVGALDSLVSGADILYTYIARPEDAIPIHGLPVAFRRVRDGGGFVFFNFPLSVMNVEAGHQALDAALVDLEGSALTNLIPATAESTAGIMRWLFGTGGSAPDPSWDVNRDGRIDILDLVETAGRFRVQRQ